MSSTSPTQTTADSSSGTSSPSASSSQSDSDTATLYLFTFLATILILVLLSASLVLRSYVLRRRYRQRFQQALDDGLLVDLDRGAFNDPGQVGPFGGMRRSARRFGPSPILWDTWIHPAGKNDTLASITPVAVRRLPSHIQSTTASESLSVASPQPLTAPGSPSSPLQPQPRPSILSQLRIPSPFSLTSRPSSPPRNFVRSPVRSPTLASIRSLSFPPATMSPDPNAFAEKDAATLAVCVLVAMPDVSAPVHRLPPDAKGKGVDSPDFRAHRQSGDADAFSPDRSSVRMPESAGGDEGLPSLQFGVVEVKTEALTS